MKRSNIAEAKQRLSEYLELLRTGKEDRVLLCKRNVPVAEIRPVPRERTKPRPLGLAKDLVSVPESFFEPLPGELLDAFEGRTKARDGA